MPFETDPPETSVERRRGAFRRAVLSQLPWAISIIVGGAWAARGINDRLDSSRDAIDLLRRDVSKCVTREYFDEVRRSDGNDHARFDREILELRRRQGSRQ